RRARLRHRLRPDRHRQCRDRNDRAHGKGRAAAQRLDDGRAADRSAARRRRGALHGEPAARRQCAVPHRHGDQNAVRRARVASRAAEGRLMETLQSGAGIAALLGLAWLLSEDRHGVPWGRVGIGLGSSFVLAALLLKVPQAKTIFALVNDGVDAIADATKAGTSFVFGYLGGGPLPFELKVPGSEFVLAFQALPVVLVMSVLTTLLFYWRVLPPIVNGFALALEKTLGIGGAVGLSTAANIFLGMVEAPLFIRPYL